MLGTGACSLCRCPTHTIVWTLRQASSPPRAATFLLTTCSAVSFESVTDRDGGGVAGTPKAAAQVASISKPPSQQPARAPSVRIQAESRLLSMAALHVRFAEQLVVQLRIHARLLQQHLVRLGIAFDPGLEHERDHHVLHAAKIALIDVN